MNCPICKGETKHVCMIDSDRYVCCNPLCGWMEGLPDAHLKRKIKGLNLNELQKLIYIIENEILNSNYAK